MQIKYFETAWNDIKNSPGWFGKICLLALLGFVPIFGQIVMLGYLYGWARQIAWGAHVPMPSSIFANEDGKFWRRGWFLFVIAFAFGLVPSIVMQIGATMQSGGMNSAFYGAYQGYDTLGAASVASLGVGSVVYFLGLALSVFISIFCWIAYMRSAIYDNLSSGFQFGKIWKMFRKDTGGIMRIFGMNLLIGLIVGVAAALLMILVVFVFAALGFGSFASLNANNPGAASAVIVFVSVAMIVLLVFVYFIMVASIFVEALVARAVGYWTMQFDVPNWRGQDDPMPFEMMAPPANPMYPMA